MSSTRKWINSPQVTLTTAYGPIVATFTSAGHVSCRTDAYVNDDSPALTYRGTDYLAHVHLYAEVENLEPWSPKPGDRVHITKRRNSAYAPRTYADAMIKAIAEAVREYVSGDSDVLRRAEYATANNNLIRLEQEYADALSAATDAGARIVAEEMRLKSAAPAS
jgi:hypothetical protein